MQARARFLVLGLAALFAVGALIPIAALGAENAVTRHFSAQSEAEASPLDHSVWGRILEQYLHESPDGVNRFDYRAVSAADRTALEAYIGGLAALRPTTLSRPVQMAYWANLYNALTVKVILDHYPVRSIRQIKFGRIFTIGPWSHDLVTVEGFDLSLNDIENLILRPVFNDPRVHYAINCASIGCPNLLVEPFVADRLENQLEAAAHDFINHPRAARIEEGRLRVSSIYVWFRQDFGGSDHAVITHLRHYADEDLRTELEGIARVSRFSYDWDLNEPEDGS